MTPADLPEVAAIDQLSFAIPWTERAYAQELQNGPLADLWVAEAVLNQSPQIIGSLVTWVIIDLAHIVTLSVHPKALRQGIATQLIRHGLDHVRQRGAIEATLEVRESNEPAQALYRRFGFEIAGRRKKYYLDNHEDALIMSVVLD
jgi:ribosomal-protein-alanine N-acetyltransferase